MNGTNPSKATLAVTALTALLLAGCASSHPTSVDVGAGPLPQKHDVPDVASVRTPEQLKASPLVEQLYFGAPSEAADV